MFEYKSHLSKHTKRTTQRKNLDNTISFGKPQKAKNSNHQILKIDFLIDSGAESNIINIPTWNEIKTLHPKLTPLETSSKTSNSTRININKLRKKFNYFFSPHKNNGAKQNFKPNHLNKYSISLILNIISLEYHLSLIIYQQSTS